MSQIWHQFSQAECLPHNCSCELIQSGLIRQPSAFWSSFIFVVATIALYRKVSNKSFEFKLWTASGLVLSFSSLFCHASFIKLAMAMDFSSIILLMSFFALINLFTKFHFSKTKMILGMMSFFFLCVLCLYALDRSTKVIVAIGIFLFTFRDLIKTTPLAKLRDKNLYISIGCLFGFFILFAMSEFKVACVPESIWQLHSIWHFGAAVSVYFYGLWRFDSNTPFIKPS